MTGYDSAMAGRYGWDLWLGLMAGTYGWDLWLGLMAGTYGWDFGRYRGRHAGAAKGAGDRLGLVTHY